MRAVPLALGFLVVGLFSLGVTIAYGSEAIPLADVFGVLWHKLSFGLGQVPEATTERIVWQLRAPRSLMAFFVGGGLAIIGVGMQALVRNPLAEPYILGISSGASAGLSLFYLGFLPPILSNALSIPLSAFLGGLLAITLVYLVAQDGRTLSVVRLLLAGVAMSALMGAVSSFVTFASPDPNKLQAVIYLLMGSLDHTHWGTLWGPMLGSLASLLLLWSLARPLDAMLLGEEAAQSLGLPVETLKNLLLVLSALVTGLMVAETGAIGFVGLIVPHTVRLVVGVSHAKVVPLSYIGGGLFLMWADLGARSLLETQLPVGIITALCGVPFFLILLRRQAYRFG